MLVLGIDTCGAAASVAVAELEGEGGPLRIVAARQIDGRSASERLVAEIGMALGSSGRATAGEIEAVVVVRGPGSFTGVRVGLSVAKGLAVAGSAGLIGVSRLRVLASLAGDRQQTVWALLDAGRGELFCGSYRNGSCLDERLATPEEARAALEREPGVAVACERAVLDRLPGAGVTLLAAPDAADALRVSLPALLRREFDDAAELDALYLRRTEAEIKARMADRIADRITDRVSAHADG